MMLTTSRASGSSITRNDAAVAIIPRPIDHAASRSVTGAVCFGPGVAEVRVHPRRGGPGSEGERTILKPHAGMTIRLTPELLATLQTPGPKPIVELMLKSVAEGLCSPRFQLLCPQTVTLFCLVKYNVCCGRV